MVASINMFILVTEHDYFKILPCETGTVWIEYQLKEVKMKYY